MPAARFSTAQAMHTFYRQLLESLNAQPGFTSVGLTTHLPLSGQDLENSFEVEGYVPSSPDQQPIAGMRGISPAYPAAMGVTVRAGRAFTEADDERGAPVVLVNEAFVRRYLSGGDPLGRRVSAGGPWRTVVGVVSDVRHRGLASEPRPEVLIPYLQLDEGFLTAWARGLNVVIRSEMSFAGAAGLIRPSVRSVDPNMPVIELRPMTAVVSQAVAEPRFRTYLLALFASVAVLLAAIGIFGVLSYLVSERTREIGIRMALGAQRGAIFSDVLVQGIKLTVVGTVLGLAAGALLTRWISVLLYRVSPADPVVIGSAALVLAAIALAAAFIPARRATRVDPIVSLRS
jgi:putative ABC transport system permease protein